MKIWEKIRLNIDEILENFKKTLSGIRVKFEINLNKICVLNLEKM